MVSEFSVVDLVDYVRSDLLKSQYQSAFVIFKIFLGIGARFQRHQFMPHRAEYIGADDVERPFASNLLKP